MKPDEGDGFGGRGYTETPVMTLTYYTSPQGFLYAFKVSKGANIRNRYNQVPHLTQDTNGKVTKF